MRGSKRASGLAAIAVGGAIVLGGCGGGSSATETSNAGAAMKGEYHAMNGDHQAMHGEKSMHEKGAGHGDAMHEG